MSRSPPPTNSEERRVEEGGRVELKKKKKCIACLGEMMLKRADKCDRAEK